VILGCYAARKQPKGNETDESHNEDDDDIGKSKWFGRQERLDE
jgi:hypothetical protein